MRIEFTVPGNAQPAGSKQAFVPIDRRTGQPYRKNGRVITNTVDANPKGKDWKAAVAWFAKEAMDGRSPLEGPLRATFLFRRERNKGHYRTGRNADKLKDDAPVFPIAKPDVLKLARAAEDALTGIVYLDDAQIVREILHKDFGDPGVTIVIEPVVAFVSESI